MKQSHISEHERKAGFTRRFLLQSHIILGALKKNIENGSRTSGMSVTAADAYGK